MSLQDRLVDMYARIASGGARRKKPYRHCVKMSRKKPRHCIKYSAPGAMRKPATRKRRMTSRSRPCATRKRKSTTKTRKRTMVKRRRRTGGMLIGAACPPPPSLYCGMERTGVAPRRKNPWIEYLQYLAEDRGIPYSQALSDKSLHEGYPGWLVSMGYAS